MKIEEIIKQFDTIVIGAGAGLSSLLGLNMVANHF